MTWQVVSRPEAENDAIEIAAWYDSRSENLGDRFVEEFLAVLDELIDNGSDHTAGRAPRRPGVNQHRSSLFLHHLTFESLIRDHGRFRFRRGFRIVGT